MEQIKQRLHYIDFVRGLAILFVVFGHLDHGDHPVCIWIYSFHIPLFFIISGILMSYKNNISSGQSSKTYFETVKKRFLALFYPYLLFNFLYITIDVMLRIILKQGSFSSIVKSFLQVILLEGYPGLWFLPALFFAELILLAFIPKKYNALYVVGLSLLGIAGTYLVSLPIIANNGILYFLTNSITRVLLATSFLAIGYYGYAFLTKIFDNCKRYLLITVAIVGFVANLFLSQLNGLTDLRCSLIHNPLFYFYGAITTSACIIIMAKLICTKDANVISYFGRNSIIIFATHLQLPLLLFIRTTWEGFVSISNRYVNDLVIFVFVMLVEVIIIEIINRFLPFLIRYPKK